MKKIISLFKRDYEGTRLVYDEVVPGAEWVMEGGGIATPKLDGTACMARDGKLYKRYDVKKGRIAPADWEPAQEKDEVTGHWPGWVPVKGGTEDKWFREGHENYEENDARAIPDGTYELIGPKVQGNPYNLNAHTLIRHGFDFRLDDEGNITYIMYEILTPHRGVIIPDSTAVNPRTFDDIKEFLSDTLIEGIVWHHEDGRMVKIKRKDFGLSWPV